MDVSSPPSDRSATFSGTERFEVRGRLGEGGMGTVYRVHDRVLGREVALKTMRRRGPEESLFLKKEFRSRAGITHPNLLQLHELFVGEDLSFFTMELVDGRDFTHWVRRDLGIGAEHPAPRTDGVKPDPGAQWSRLRDGLAQVVRGLSALHDHGRVHRDVKPENVLVAGGSRLILLDFGLATELHDDDGSPGRRSDFAGTPAYMAPEQFLEQQPTRASDLYGVGVMLYEALAGVLPFRDSPTALFVDKLRSSPPHLRELAHDAPVDLVDLAMDLLALDPERRPGAARCLTRLTGDPTREAAPAVEVPSMSSPPRRSFVGRTAEIAVLQAAFVEVAERRRQVTIHLHGPSGIGKSTLAREFVVARRRAGDPLVLQARCHPEESVPYKALDAVVDGIADHLDAQPASEVETLVRAETHALLRLFPVLAKLGSFGRAPAPAVKLDAIELRQRGAEALRELFARLADRRPLVVWLDDLQWGDIDSAPLLDELLRPPAPPFLLLLTYRGDEHEWSPLVRHLRAARAPGDGDITLGALGSDDVAKLVRALVGPEHHVPIDAVTAQSEGNPFVACELARHLGALATRSGAEARLGPVDVVGLILERVHALNPVLQGLMEVAAVAGRPLDRSIALAAAGLDEGARPVVSSLRDASLLREVASDGPNAVAVYHDRIREALLATLPAERRAMRHRGIAEALTASRSNDFEALLLHWERAGERRLAGTHAERAAERAAAALAFDHAATLYERSLELLGGHADRPLLLEKLGDVLANHGRAPEAASRFLEAAAALGGGTTRRVHDLKRRAAEQYIKSGRIDQGWQEMRSILEDLDIPIPGSVLGAVGAATWRRVAFLLHPLDVDARNYAPPPVDEQYRMDVLWSASTGWAMINHTLADTFRVMHLLRAVKASDRSTLCRSLAYEAAMEVHVGGGFFNGNAAKLRRKVEHLVNRTGDSYDRAWVDLLLANVGYAQGRWREAADACSRADDLFRERCPGSAWERVTVAIFHHHALAMLGDLPRLRARLDAFQKDATRRADIYATCEAYVNEPVLAWLADDQADHARARASEALAAQTARSASWPESSYRRQHFADLVAQVYASAYRNDPWPAWRAVVAQWPALRAAFLLPLRITGLGIRHARARAALAAAATLAGKEGPPPGVDRRWTRRALLDDAREQLGIIAKDPAGCAEPIACTVRAGLAHLRGEGKDAQRELERAVAGFAREEMALYREAARYVLGELRGGREGEALAGRAREWMTEHGVVKPRAMAAAMVPGAMKP